MLGTIRIEQEQPSAIGKNMRVYLDDKEISHFVRQIDISVGVDFANQVTLHCVGYVELPEELQAYIEVVVPTKDDTTMRVIMEDVLE